MANFVLSGDPAPAKTRTCTLVFWCFVLPDVSPHAAVGRFLEDFWIMRFCYMHVYPGFLALCTSCDLLNKSIVAAICYVSSVNGVFLVPLWRTGAMVLWKKCCCFGQTQSKTINPGTRGVARRQLPETSYEARLKPYFSRACPQDDVSSTRQTPSN